MRKLTVALAALEPEDAGRFEGFARGQAASGLLRAALAKPFRQAIAAAQRVRLQLADDAVRPPRRDLVHRHVRATVGGTVDGIRRHRHTKPKSEIRISKSETNPDEASRARFFLWDLRFRSYSDLFRISILGFVKHAQTR